LRRREAVSAGSGGEIEISALLATHALLDQAHQDFMAPLQLLPDDLRCFDDKKTLPKEFSKLLGRKRLVQ
jgi:hypothetical protein